MKEVDREAENDCRRVKKIVPIEDLAGREVRPQARSGMEKRFEKSKNRRIGDSRGP